MLFSPDTPMAHRGTFFLAGLFTVNLLLGWYSGWKSGFNWGLAAIAAGLWLLCLFQWQQRRRRDGSLPS
ncbi:MAG TPA: hypothetical protein VF723_00475 [Pyrinomonadaceae bacterium]|jgi:hypothetical protein